MISLLGCGQPTLGINFTTASFSVDWSTLDSLTSSEGYAISYTRNSRASCYNSNGDLAFGEENTYLYSEDFSNAAWVKSNLTVGTSTTSDVPIAGMTAWYINETTTSGTHEISQSGFEVAKSNKYTVSVYAKDFGRNLRIVSNQGFFGTQEYSIFDLVNGVVSTQGTNSQATITSVGSGWYRCRVTMTATAFGSASFYLDSCVYGDTGRVTSYAGDVTKGLLISGAMVSFGPTLFNYTKTVATAYYKPRFDYVSTTLVRRGLLVEPSATNIINRSQEYENSLWTKTDVTCATTTDTNCPRGYSNAAYKCTEGTAGTALLVSNSPTITASSKYVTSHYIKKGNFDWVRIRFMSSNSNGGQLWFNLTTGAFGTIQATNSGTSAVAGVQVLKNGWYRIFLSCIAGTDNSTSTHICSADADLSTTRIANAYYYLGGSQIELGVYPTSYIYTRASSASRSADYLTISSGAWFNATEASAIIEYNLDYIDTVNNMSGLSITDGTASNRINLRLYSTPNVSKQYILVSSGSTLLSLTEATPSTNAFNKTGFFYKASDNGFLSNGGTIIKGSSAIPLSLNRLDIGNYNNTEFIRGCIKSIKYFNQRISDTEMISRTT